MLDKCQKGQQTGTKDKQMLIWLGLQIIPKGGIWFAFVDPFVDPTNEEIALVPPRFRV